MREGCPLFLGGVVQQDVVCAVRFADEIKDFIKEESAAAAGDIKQKLENALAEATDFFAAIPDPENNPEEFLKSLRKKTHGAAHCSTIDMGLTEMENKIGDSDDNAELLEKAKKMREVCSYTIGCYAVLSLLANSKMSLTCNVGKQLRRDLEEAMQVFHDDWKCPELIQAKVDEILNARGKRTPQSGDAASESPQSEAGKGSPEMAARKRLFSKRQAAPTKTADDDTKAEVAEDEDEAKITKMPKTVLQPSRARHPKKAKDDAETSPANKKRKA